MIDSAKDDNDIENIIRTNNYLISNIQNKSTYKYKIQFGGTISSDIDAKIIELTNITTNISNDLSQGNAEFVRLENRVHIFFKLLDDYIKLLEGNFSEDKITHLRTQLDRVKLLLTQN